jgi:hypothetical protein
MLLPRLVIPALWLPIATLPARAASFDCAPTITIPGDMLDAIKAHTQEAIRFGL